MKVAILAGGQGTRLMEETRIKPKPLVEIGGQPILWHIMMHYSHYGYNDFVIALGYKGEQIRLWAEGLHGNRESNWKIKTVETGLETMTGGRIKRLKSWVGNQTFMLTWADGISNVNLDALLRFHTAHGRLATLTVVHPPPRFGHVICQGERVVRFSEKPAMDNFWINGAFFVLEPGIFDYIEGDMTQWEKQPMENLVKDGQLMAYKHSSFWRCMDTLYDKLALQTMWDEGNAPWKIWD
ncbi:MAG: glucose-1-phosphate cytidylyltransferase [Gammaproteobacteria bacterium]